MAEFRYEVVNPSDRYEMVAASFEIAALANAFLGEGRYGLSPLGATPSERMPIFLFGGAEEWFAKTFGAPFEALIERADREQIAAALDSVAASLPDRKRSSMNNIGGYAADLAKRFREVSANG